MFPIGGYPVMLLGALGVGAALVVLAVLAGRWMRWLSAWSVAGLLWSLAVIALVTLIPAQGAPGIVPAEGRLDSCSWDIGGPAPDGFWIFESGQRLLNTLLFVPSGVLVVLAATRLRGVWPWLLVPLGVVALAAYSIGIEAVQLWLARIDRACDVTDVIDNVTGALIGVVAGVGGVAVARVLRSHP
ncbi:MAG TPA: VanZ family protein [Nocardioides sp.]|uniref:VanZ family protein n=1 Tax=Nocardioides sp. TaxID=35761 RepID=UPI002EDAA0D5